jgi:hypothetical protein
LITQFNALKREVDKAATNLTDAAEKAGAQIKARSTALANQAGGDTAAVRQRIIGKLEGQPTFAKLADGLSTTGS